MTPLTHPSLLLREAGPDDAEVLADLVSQLAVYEDLQADNFCTAEAMREELSAEHRALEAVIAQWDGEVVGMATFFQTYSTFAAKRGLYLEDIFVVEGHRHRGIGTALLSHVVRLARDRGYGRVEWTTLLWNTPAIEFYEAMGAKPNDAWTTYRIIGPDMDRLAGSDEMGAS